MLINKEAWRAPQYLANHIKQLGIVLTAAAAGWLLVAAVNAATFSVPIEAESGSLSHANMVIAATGASNGKSALFGPLSGTAIASFLSFGHDVYNFVPGSQKTIDGITLRLTSGGDFQVVNSSGSILWHTGTSANCISNCTVILQSDGNLVLNGPNGVLWSSGTYNVYGATFLFQPREPYLTIRNGEYVVVWTSNNNNAAGALGMLNGAVAAPAAPSVQSFLDSLAVNTHMDQYEGDAAKLVDKMNYLGIRHIRDHYSADDSLLNQYTYLAQHNIKVNMLSYSNDFAVLQRDAEIMAGLPNNTLAALEGPNEINNFPFTCNGSTWQGGWPNNNGPAAQCFMQKYYNLVHSDPKLSGVPLYDLTGNTSVNNPDLYGLLSLSQRADLGNIHAYPANNEQPHYSLLVGLGSTYLSVIPNQSVITETGYSSSQVGERAQAIYYLNLYLDAFQEGFKRTYIYELTDNPSETYGFYTTANTAKQPANAVHNLTGILADSGSMRDGTLAYSLGGAPKEAQSLALQRSDGSYDLILWDERPIWNGGNIVPSPATVSVGFGRQFSKVEVYKPASSSSIVQQLGSSSAASLQLSGEPLILHLIP